MPTLATLPAASAVSFFREKSLTNAAVVADANSGSIRMIDCDNTANTATTFFKIYNLAAASVVFHASTAGSSTNPYIQIAVPSSKRVVVTVDSTDATLGTAISCAALTTGGTLGTTAPTAAVGIRMLLS